MIYRADLVNIKDLAVNISELYDLMVNELSLDEKGQEKLVDELKYQFSKAACDIQALKNENEYLDTENAELAQNVETLEEDYCELEDENYHLQEEIDRLMQENEELRGGN